MDGKGRGSSSRERTAALLQDLLLALIALAVDVVSNLRLEGAPDTLALPVGTTVVMATLVFRRRFPVAVLGVQVAYGLMLVALVPVIELTAGLLIALYTVASRREPSLSVPGLLAVAVVANAQYVNAPGRDEWEHPYLLVLLQGLLLLAVWGAGHRSWTNRRRLATLAADQREAEDRALRAERLRIARELHDIVASSVSVMVVQAAGARTVLQSDTHRADAALGVIQQSGTQAMAELRRLLGLLRSAGDTSADATLGPGVEGVGELLDQMRGTGLTIAYQVSGTPAPLDASVSLACYRIVQEAVTNTVKHAGLDACLDVHVDWHEDCLTLEIADHGGSHLDDGKLSTGHGLLGLRERVSTLGGALNAEPTADGFTVRAELPVTNNPPLAAVPV